MLQCLIPLLTPNLHPCHMLELCFVLLGCSWGSGIESPLTVSVLIAVLSAKLVSAVVLCHYWSRWRSFPWWCVSVKYLFQNVPYTHAGVAWFCHPYTSDHSIGCSGSTQGVINGSNSKAGPTVICLDLSQRDFRCPNRWSRNPIETHFYLEVKLFCLFPLKIRKYIKQLRQDNAFLWNELDYCLLFSWLWSQAKSKAHTFCLVIIHNTDIWCTVMHYWIVVYCVFIVWCQLHIK